MPYLPPRPRPRTPARLDTVTGRLVYLDPAPVSPAALPVLDPTTPRTDTEHDEDRDR